MTSSTPFDDLAPGYDGAFTETIIGRYYREAVWRQIDRIFLPGQRVLDVGCGTGEDAMHLANRGVRVVASDASPAMVQAAKRKIEVSRLDGRAAVVHCSAENLASRLCDQRFDGILSNFGSVNCMADLEATAQSWVPLLTSRATVVICAMGPVVPWEWIWYLLRARPAKAFRRFRRGGVPWRGMRIHYRSIRRVTNAFGPGFRVTYAAALGVLLPPPYTEKWAARHMQVLERLNRWERALEARFPFPHLGDHYLLVLSRP